MDETTPTSLDFDVLAANVGVQVHLTRRALWARASRLRPKRDARRPSGYVSAFILIGANPGVSQKRLADELFLDAGAIVDIIDLLEAEKLVERSRDPADRRRMCLSVTESGQHKLREMRKHSQAQDVDVRACLSEAEAVLLVSLLKRLRE